MPSLSETTLTPLSPTLSSEISFAKLPPYLLHIPRTLRALASCGSLQYAPSFTDFRETPGDDRQIEVLGEVVGRQDHPLVVDLAEPVRVHERDGFPLF